MQVEERFGVELADGGAVRAAHVVGADLQFGFGVDDGVVGQDQILVGLLGIGLLRVFADDDLAVEDGVGFAVQNAFIEFVAGAVRLGVVDDRVIVDVLRAVDDVEAVQGGVEPSERMALASLRTSAPPSEMECDENVALLSDAGLQGGDVERGRRFLLQLVVIHHGAVANDDLGDGVGEVVRRSPL